MRELSSLGRKQLADPALFRRLNEHKCSILAAENLELDEFHCRHPVSDDIWIPLGENLLIEMFTPLWNVLVTGFGNHDPGQGRRGQEKPLWDTLHPGRTWAAVLRAHTKTAGDLERMVVDFFAGRQVPSISAEKAVTEEES